MLSNCFKLLLVNINANFFIERTKDALIIVKAVQFSDFLISFFILAGNGNISLSFNWFTSGSYVIQSSCVMLQHFPYWAGFDFHGRGSPTRSLLDAWLFATVDMIRIGKRTSAAFMCFSLGLEWCLSSFNWSSNFESRILPLPRGATRGSRDFSAILDDGLRLLPNQLGFRTLALTVSKTWSRINLTEARSEEELIEKRFWTEKLSIVNMLQAKTICSKRMVLSIIQDHHKLTHQHGAYFWHRFRGISYLEVVSLAFVSRWLSALTLSFLLLN